MTNGNMDKTHLTHRPARQTSKNKQNTKSTWAQTTKTHRQQKQQEEWQLLNNQHHKSEQNTISHTSIPHMVSNMRCQQRQSRQSHNSKTYQQASCYTSGLYIHESQHRKDSNANTHCNRRGNRHEHGSPGHGQTTTVQVPDTHSLHNFLLECGRTHAILANTVLQSDQKDVLMALLKATAVSLGSNISVRQASAYSSQSQGSVERFHRTLMGQVRTLKTQLQNNYHVHLTSQHPIMPWLVRHAAYLLTRYATHSDGNRSYFRRWQREHKAPLCEFGETVQYMVPTVKGLPKLEPRFFESIWLGKDTSTNDSIIGIPYKIVRARTIRRQVEPEKHNQQLLDSIGNKPWTPTTTFETAPQVIPLALHQRGGNHRSANDVRDTAHYRNRAKTTFSANNVRRKAKSALGFSNRNISHITAFKASITTSIFQTGDGGRNHRRQHSKATADYGSTSATVTAKTGEEITATTIDDPDEAATERILLEPFVANMEGFDKQKTIKGMKHEVGQMKTQQVYTEAKHDDLTPEEQSNIIESKWVFRDKTTEVRARILAKGFTEVINHLDSIYASTPMFCILRILLTVALAQSWVATGDITTAFLHATAATSNLWPPEFYNGADRIAWKLNKAIYGLFSLRQRPGRPFGTNTAAQYAKAENRAQCLLQQCWNSLHHGICRRSLFCRTTAGTRHVQRYTKTTSTTSNRNTHHGTDHHIPWPNHYT